MSIFIKGMEMPKSCYDCFVPCLLIYYLNDYERKRIRHPKCPIVEVPTPHGRLVDADEVIDAMSIHDCMKLAPTVIESED